MVIICPKNRCQLSIYLRWLHALKFGHSFLELMYQWRPWKNGLSDYRKSSTAKRQPYLPTTLSRACSTLGPFAYILDSTWSFFPELWIHFLNGLCVCMCLCLHVQSQKALDPLELVTGDVSHLWWTLGTEFWSSGRATLSAAEPSLQLSRLVLIPED